MKDNWLLIIVVSAIFAVGGLYELHQRDGRMEKELAVLNADIAEIKSSLNCIKARELKEAALPKLAFIHAILRPDPQGKWYVQNDVDHSPHGIHPDHDIQLIQNEKGLNLYFDKRYAKAGVIQITLDDGFSGVIVASASLGLEGTNIGLRAYPEISPLAPTINPRDIWKYVRNKRKDNGNLWVSVTMFDNPETNSNLCNSNGQ